MKTIQVNAYEYKELCQDSKFKVKLWLDEIPFEYETGDLDEQGKPVVKNDYASEWDENDIQEHCEMNKYYFDKYGNCVHHLDISRNKKEAA